jgi:oxidase EvaA
MSIIDSSSFFFSSLTKENKFQNFRTFHEWLKERCCPEEFKVDMVPLDEMEKWTLDKNGIRISHESGRFFHIEGIHVKTNFGGNMEWDQPIINQPEIGFLGFITRVFNGTRYFLMQAKMEPGNINTLQISPSLQATKSNFSQVHKGKRPTFLEFFNGEKKVKILTDHLQTEQGGRFYQKRNRNIVIEINEDIELPEEFCWLTLGELKALLREDNVLNMDTRSVLSTIPLIEDEVINHLEPFDLLDLRATLSHNGEKFLKSFVCKESVNTIEDLLSWYTKQKTQWEIEVTKKPLSQLDGWQINKMAVEGDERFFSVIGVKVTAGTREVTHWMQPLLRDPHIGLLAFVCQHINGVLHFLVQAKVEPGNLDIIELSPTVSCSNYEYVKKKPQRPFLFDEVFNSSTKVLYDSLQSEEGGRFYQIQNRNMMVQIPENLKLELPYNYAWMTLAQMKEFMRYGMFNIEARSIISAISFID